MLLRRSITMLPWRRRHAMPRHLYYAAAAADDDYAIITITPCLIAG